MVDMSETNEQLKQARLKRGWTQEDVAAEIGAEAFTVGRWERGTQPPSLYYQQKLCKLFGMSVEELGFLKEKMIASEMVQIVSGIWNVPYERNPYFIDQKKQVQHLHTLFHAEETGVRQVCISGLGGVGKTQLALEYAYRYRASYQVVLWIRAGTRAHIFGDLVTSAYLLGVPETKKREPKQHYLVNEALHWLQTHCGWLLILDNVEEDLHEGHQGDEKSALRGEDTVWKDLAIERLLFTLRNGYLLLTTRVQSIANLTENVLLDVMQPEDGAHLLLRRSHLFSASSSEQMVTTPKYEEAVGLSQLLGGLPLAIEQAAAYIQETGCGLVGYRVVYETSRKEVLQTNVKYKRLYTDYSESVATTWLVSFRRVAQQSGVASDLLKLCAYLAPDSIPENLFLIGASTLEGQLRQLEGNTYLFDRTCQVLLNYSLIKRFAEGTILSIHRLVQAVLQDTMENEEQRFWAGQAIRAVEHASCATSKRQIDLYMYHALVCSKSLKDLKLQGEEVAHLLEMMAKAVYDRGYYAIARPLYMHALVAANRLGDNDPRVLSLLLGVARVHMDLEFAHLAIAFYQTARERFEERFGSAHPEVIACINSQAEAQVKARLYFDAEKTCQEALAWHAQQEKPDTIQQARTYHIAADVALGLHQLDLAEALYKLALEMRKQMFGINHLEVAKGCVALSFFYLFCESDLQQAERLLRHALKIRLNMLGDDHPDTAENLFYLAICCWEQKNYVEAEDCYRQALEIRRQKLGPYHPGVAYVLQDLAMMTAEQGKDQEAEQYFREIFALIPLAGGKETYEYALLLESYKKFLEKQGKINEADKYDKERDSILKRLKIKGTFRVLNLSYKNGEGEELPPSGVWFIRRRSKN